MRTEVANALARGANRALFVELYGDLADDRRMMIVPPALDLFEEGIEFYAKRPDEEWSVTLEHRKQRREEFSQ